MFGFTKATLMQYPSGKWGFVGKVAAKLAYLGTDAEIAKAVDAGCTQFLKVRVYTTPEEAKTAYAEVMGEPYAD